MVNRLASWIIILGTPLILITIALRLIMLPSYLNFAYNSVFMTEDAYGFGLEDRLALAPSSLEYLSQFHAIDYLAEQRLKEDLCYATSIENDSCALFNDRELKHMEDVQRVVKATFISGIFAFMLMLISLIYLIKKRSFFIMRSAFIKGSLFCLASIFLLCVLVIGAWDLFFTNFHLLFFDGQSWLFLYSDSLIRLFPESFWVMSAIWMGILVFIGAGIIFVAAYTYPHQQSKSN